MQTVSVLGCGWLGLPLGVAFATSGWRVFGSTTSTAKFPALEAAGISPFHLDLAAPKLPDLSLFLACDLLIVAVPPGKLPDYANAIARVVAAAAQRPKILFISSTGVYPETEGLFDETHPLTPANTPRPEILAAELLLYPSDLILRCAGLMGYDRIAGKRQIRLLANAPVNHVHRDDVIAAACLLIEKNASGTYNLCAPQHPMRRELYQTNAARYGLATPRFATDSPVINRRIDGTLLIREFGFGYAHPDPLRF